MWNSFPDVIIIFIFIDCSCCGPGKQTVRWGPACREFAGHPLSIQQLCEAGRKRDGVAAWLGSNAGLSWFQGELWSWGDPSELSLFVWKVCVFIPSGPSVMDANCPRKGHDLRQGAFPQLRQLGTFSLQLSLGNETVGPEEEIWVAQHGIHDRHLAEAFGMTCAFETSVTPSMTWLWPHPKASLVIPYLLVASNSSFSIFLNNLLFFLTILFFPLFHWPLS